MMYIFDFQYMMYIYDLYYVIFTIIYIYILEDKDGRTEMHPIPRRSESPIYLSICKMVQWAFESHKS